MSRSDADAARRTGDALVAEIGSWKGRSTIALAYGLRTGGGGRVVAIDPHVGSIEHQSALGVDTYEEFLGNITAAGIDGLVEPRRERSIDARDAVANRTLDVLFVDGSHEYDDVVCDIEMWTPALKDVAVVGFNDPLWPGVDRALRKLVARRDSSFHNPRYVDNTLFFEFARDRPQTRSDTVRLRRFLLIGLVRASIARVLKPLLPDGLLRAARSVATRVGRAAAPR
jgi:predicted O-methyltransferase YrrM